MNGANFEHWAHFILRRRLVFIEAAAVVMAMVVGVTFLWPPVYKSTADILVQDNRAQLLVSPALDNNTAAQTAIVANAISEQDLNSERELLTSSYLIGQALDGLPLPRQGVIMTLVQDLLDVPTWFYRFLHSAPPETARAAWVRHIARHFSADVLKRSDIIELSFSAHDQAWSHEFLARLINKYLEFHSKLSHDPQAEKFFQAQAKLLQSRLQAAEEQLRAYQVQTGITNLGEQKQALITRISQLQNDEATTAASLAAAQQRVTALHNLEHKTPMRVRNEVKSVQNLALQTLKPQVLKLETERADLITRYQPDSERIKAIDARLAAAKRILSREDHLDVQEQSTNLNPVWVQLDTDLQQASAQAASMQANRNALGTQIAKAQEEVTRLLNSGVKAERLQRLVDTEKQAYMSYLRRGEEARAAGALNRSKILNVSVAEPPTHPTSPSFPIVPLNLAAGLILALAAGIGAAWIEEQFDPRLYSPAAINTVAGLKTLAQLRELNQE